LSAKRKKELEAKKELKWKRESAVERGVTGDNNQPPPGEEAMMKGLKSMPTETLEERIAWIKNIARECTFGGTLRNTPLGDWKEALAACEAELARR